MRYVASIGALITILALGVDPIVQQTISIKTRQAISTAPASLSRAQSFLQYDDLGTKTFKPYDEDNGISIMFSLPLPEMVGAMFAGMFSGDTYAGGTSFNVDPSCMTGNCTFPPFQTLAVCSSCEDVTQSLKLTCYRFTSLPDDLSEGLDDSIQVISPGESLFNASDSHSSTNCMYSLPNGLELNKTSKDSSLGTVAARSGLRPVGTISYGNTLLNFTMIWGGAPVDGKIIATNVTATQCFLYWCVNTLNVTVSNGRLSETQVDSWHSDTTLWRNGTTASNLVNPDPESGNFAALEQLRSDLNPPSLDLHDSAANFTVSWAATQALTWWFSEKLNISTSYNTTSVTFGPSDMNEKNSPIREMTRLLRTANMTSVFTNLAKSMTQYVRRQSLDLQRTGMNASVWAVPGVGDANGTSLSTDIYVSVRWGWLAFPVALLLLVTIFLGLTMLGTARNKLELWKSSPLPLVLRGIEPPVEEPELVAMNKIAEMENVAVKTNVMLKDCDAGLRLVR